MCNIFGNFTPTPPYTPKAVCINFGMWGHVLNVINPAEFQLYQFRGFGAPGGRKSLSSINWISPLPSARQHPSYGDCLEVKREYYQNCCMLGCVTQCSQSAAHSYEQFLQVQQIGFVTLGPLRHA